MRPIGYSTGSLARSDFQRAIDFLSTIEIRAVELSALRIEELNPLLALTEQVDLSQQFDYISFHAPSKIPKVLEAEVVHQLEAIRDRNWPIVVHPDVIATPELWKCLNGALCIENMDKRKPVGRTKRELDEIFEIFPHSNLCFDIAHAKQIDPSMSEAAEILVSHGHRIKQIHISDLRHNSSHCGINRVAMLTFQKVCDLIPDNVPLILESPTVDNIEEEWVWSQIEAASNSIDPQVRFNRRRSSVIMRNQPA